MKKNLNNELVSGAAIRDGKGKNIARQFSDIVTGATPVAYANKLIMPTAPTDQEFIYRTTGGENQVEDGVAQIESIKGNTLVWNQLLKKDNYSATYYGISYSKNDDGSIHIEGTATQDTTAYKFGKIKVNEGDKILARVSNAEQRFLLIRSTDGGSQSNINFTSINRFLSVSGYNELTFGLYVSNGDAVNRDTFVAFHNLTKMFGPGNEPTTIEEFEARKPKLADEYAYNEGELISNTAEQIKSVGRNLWDLKWEQGGIDSTGKPNNAINEKNTRTTDYYHCFSGMELYSNSTIYFYFFEYDANKNFIYSSRGKNIITSKNTHYLKFQTFNSGGISKLEDSYKIIVSSKEIDKYEPYHESILTLPKVAVLFPDGLKSAGTAYDEITPKKAIKRIGVRAYQAGDESNESVMTDGQNTTYALETPIEVEFEQELNLAYDIEAGGTEEAIYPEGVNGAPFKASMGYAIDAAQTIAKNKAEIADLKQRIIALESKTNNA